MLLLGDEQACPVAWWADEQTARVVLPELGEGEVRWPVKPCRGGISAIRSMCAPVSLRCPHPGGRSNPRPPLVWGTLAENAPLYRDVLLAALINLFAVALPLLR